MAALGQLNSNVSWSESLRDLKEIMDKWGKRDYILPTYDESKRNGVVLLKFAVNGVWDEIPSGRWPLEPAKNLRALVLALDGARKADQRGLGMLFRHTARMMALTAGDGTPYKVLGVPEATTDKTVLQAAFRAAIKRTHPDTGGKESDYEAVIAAGRALGMTVGGAVNGTTT